MDVSKIKINDNIYNVKDEVARQDIKELEDTVNNILINYVGAYPIKNILFEVTEV